MVWTGHSSTDAQGQGLFKIADNELSLTYKLIASNISNGVKISAKR